MAAQRQRWNGSLPSVAELAELPLAGHEPPPPRAADEGSGHCAALWCSVVLQAVVDSLHPGTAAADAAREWLSRPTRDRAIVLELAGIDPQAFVTRGLPRLQASWLAIDAAPPPQRRKWSEEQNKRRRETLQRRSEARLSCA